MGIRLNALKGEFQSAQTAAATAVATQRPPRKVRNPELEKAAPDVCYLKMGVKGIRDDSGKLIYILPDPDGPYRVDANDHPVYSPCFPSRLTEFSISPSVPQQATLAQSVSVEEIKAAVEQRFSTLQRMYREQTDPNAKNKKAPSIVQNRRAERKRDLYAHRTAGIPGFYVKHPEITAGSLECFIIKDTMPSDKFEAGRREEDESFPPPGSCTPSTDRRLPPRSSPRPASVSARFWRVLSLLPRSTYSARWLNESGNSLLPAIDEPADFDASTLAIADSKLFRGDLAHVKELEAYEAGGQGLGANAAVGAGDGQAAVIYVNASERIYS
ncbi:hypothetical protein NMY22_g9859 [Coprinellus aureogranulatus]|nr:hypothetical protein NMY22_g9859 [Coprinellus aureogranulatus]